MISLNPYDALWNNVLVMFSYTKKCRLISRVTHLGFSLQDISSALRPPWRHDAWMQLTKGRHLANKYFSCQEPCFGLPWGVAKGLGDGTNRCLPLSEAVHRFLCVHAGHLLVCFQTLCPPFSALCLQEIGFPGFPVFGPLPPLGKERHWQETAGLGEERSQDLAAPSCQPHMVSPQQPVLLCGVSSPAPPWF